MFLLNPAHFLFLVKYFIVFLFFFCFFVLIKKNNYFCSQL